MKSNIAAWAIAAGLLLSAVGLAAQDSTTTTQQQTTTTSTTSTDNSSSSLSDKDSAATPNASATATQDNSTDRSANVRTVTGCLQKGDSGNEYQLTGQDGSTWELRSDAVDLASHVGHTVTVTGAVRNAGLHGLKEDTKREAEQHGVGNSTAEHGHMTVTHLKMVSHGCS